VITPRRTRLIRVPDLRSYRAAIHDGLRAAGPSAVVVVPTRSAAEQISSPLTKPCALTREELYEHLRAQLTDPPRRLSPLEREAIAQASANAAADLTGLTFKLRPGLVAEMIRFYDQLRRQAVGSASHPVRRFRELILESLGDDDVDRGTSRLRRQTEFLAAAFAEYERRVRESGAVDEHALREHLMATAPASQVETILVTIADWIAEADGLFAADFDLLTRLPGLRTIDVIATEALLASGYHERLHTWLPEIEETNLGSREASPRLMIPAGTPPETPWWTFRDREEELRAIARFIKEDRRADDGVPADRIAVVFKKPLPYLYLAEDVFGSAGIPHQSFDARPLAAEPAAAALDLILEAADANFTRDALVALLRSPFFTFAEPGETVPREAISALDRELSRLRYLGDRQRLEGLTSVGRDAAPAYRAALEIASELGALREPGRASVKLRHLLSLWQRHTTTGDSGPLFDESRQRRACGAITQTLQSLADIHAAHHDPDWALADLALAVRRAIEEQTFAPAEQKGRGIKLLDDRAARYADCDDIFIVGLVDAEWPERPRRNIFYPSTLLKALGWPPEKDRRSAADASFLDLVRSGTRRTTISTFTLEDDALIARSMQLDDLSHARLSTFARVSTDPAARIFRDEALTDPVAWDAIDEPARSWARVRSVRTDAADMKFHGSLPVTTSRPWSVSALETYIGCPFRFFARHLLDLEEDPTDEEIMDPRRQGQFVHDVFEHFFAAWQRAGHGAITEANLEMARTMFGEVAEDCLAALPQAEAGLERTRLLGSPAAVGLGEAVIRMEAERPVPVVERLIEHRLDGEFTIQTADGVRRVQLRGKADRIDLLADGTFRLIDYKLGWPPDRRKALQLPIYSVCAEQRLNGHLGRGWMLGEAAYLAFKGPRRVVPLFKDASERGELIAGAQQRLAETLDAIAAGRFPPTPDDVFRCETCSYTSVCRMDYVGDV
jgi:RecB family exonuclease